MINAIARLHAAILGSRPDDPVTARTAKLLADGMPKIAKKMAEEAVEVALDAVQGRREATISESADLIYNLCVVWAQAGIHPDEVWREMERRERRFGIAGKVPKSASPQVGKAQPVSDDEDDEE